MWGDIVPLIQDMLIMPKGSNVIIRKVLKDVMEAIALDEEYDPSKGPKERGRNPVIHDKSNEAAIIITSMQSGIGIAQSTALCNEFQRPR